MSRKKKSLSQQVRALEDLAGLEALPEREAKKLNGGFKPRGRGTGALLVRRATGAVAMRRGTGALRFRGTGAVAVFRGSGALLAIPSPRA